MPPTVFRPGPLESHGRTLRHCNHCHRAQDVTVQLKKCSGCRCVEYCSKECQKSAWPRHKQMCNTACKMPEEQLGTIAHQPMLNSYGFKTGGEAMDALKAFILAHRWAVNVHALVWLRRKLGFRPPAGDVKDWVFVSNFECVTSASRSQKRLGPAASFKLVGQRFVPMDEFREQNRHRAAMFAQWSAPQRDVTTDKHKNDPRFLGTYPAMYNVEPMGLCSSLRYALYAPHPALLALESDEKRHQVLDDLAALSVASINAGISLRAVEKEAPLAVLPGHFVRTNKMWTWKALVNDWEAYLRADPRPQEAALLDEAIVGFKSGMPIAQLVPWGHFL